MFHINAIDREADGDYVVTARHMDGIFRVDHATKNVEWTLGTPPARNLQPAGPLAPKLTIVGDTCGGPKRPHDARLNGNVLTMMDNQAQPGASCSPRAVAYDINVAAGTATLLWQISNAAPGGATLGSTQQTADSVVVNWGAGQQPFLEEFAYDGTRYTRIMAVGLPNSGNSYRTIKYAPSEFDINVLRSTAGGFVASP